MDTSEVYVKMCREAKEIQSKKTAFDKGDIYFWQNRFNKDNKDVHISLNQEEYSGLKWSKDSYNRINGEQFGGFAVWLPRQDQLQAMLKLPIWTLNQGFQHWFLEYADIKINDARTMEVLWLEYVMRKLYFKRWNGQTWEEIK